jgi:hypothetical protein
MAEGPGTCSKYPVSIAKEKVSRRSFFYSGKKKLAPRE